VRFQTDSAGTLRATRRTRVVSGSNRTGDCDDGVRQAITSKIIELAEAGEHNPDVLCEQALAAIRWQPE
jgi:hypothetical protein